MVVGGRELIDTLWNVNHRMYSPVLQDKSELIDTLWNVNEKFTQFFHDLGGN